MNISHQNKPSPLTKIITTAVVLSGVTLLTACDGQVVKPEPSSQVAEIELSKQGLQQIVNKTLDDVVIANHTQWLASAKQFNLKVNTFCEKTNAANLQNVQNGFQELATNWNRSIMFDFGPLRDNLFFPKIHFIESMRQRGKDYSAAVKSHQDKLLLSKQLVNAEYFAKQKFTLVGMSAIEPLLYSADIKSLLDTYHNPRKCQILSGLALLNVKNSEYVVNGWQQQADGKLGFRELFRENKLPDGEKSLTKLIFSMQDYLRYIVQRKLNGKMDYQLSRLGYENLTVGLKTIRQTFTANNNGFALSDYLIKSAKANVAEKFLLNLDKTLESINSQDRKVIAANYSVLIKMLEKELPQALGVNLGMNFVDGD